MSTGDGETRMVKFVIITVLVSMLGFFIFPSFRLRWAWQHWSCDCHPEMEDGHVQECRCSVLEGRHGH